MPVVLSVHEPALRREMTAVCGSPEPSSKPNAYLRPLRRLGERRARGVERRAGILLVAMHDDGDAQLVEHARRLERSQRFDDDDVPALHVDDAGTARRRVAQPLELLERTARLEHRIEVPDQQDPRTRPFRSATRCPARLKPAPSTHFVVKPNASSSRPKRIADLTDAGEVHRPAVDVDDALEQRERLRVALVDRGDRFDARWR